MTQLTPLQQIDKEIARVEANIANAAELEKLHSNKQFKKLILEGYFEKLPVQLVPMLAQPQLSDQVRKGIELQLEGIGSLQNYFSSVYRQAEAAVDELNELHELRVEHLQGE